MKLNVKEIALFGMLGALMYASKIALEVLPNVHLLGVFTVSMTIVYRKKALYPIYIFVFLLGLLDSSSVSLDSALGSCHAAAEKHSG